MIIQKQRSWFSQCKQKLDWYINNPPPPSVRRSSIRGSSGTRIPCFGLNKVKTCPEKVAAVAQWRGSNICYYSFAIPDNLPLMSNTHEEEEKSVITLARDNKEKHSQNSDCCEHSVPCCCRAATVKNIRSGRGKQETCVMCVRGDGKL